MDKKEIAFCAVLLGMIIGMASSLVVKYSVDVNILSAALNYSCGHDKPAGVRVSMLGTSIDIECPTGEVHHYQTSISGRTSVEVN